MDNIVSQSPPFFTVAEEMRHVIVELAQAVQFGVHSEYAVVLGDQRFDVIERTGHGVTGAALVYKQVMPDLKQVVVCHLFMLYPFDRRQKTGLLDFGHIIDIDLIGIHMVVDNVGATAPFTSKLERPEVEQSDKTTAKEKPF